MPTAGGKLVDERGSGQILDKIRVGKRRRDLKVRSQTHGRVPAVRDEADAVLPGHPGNSPLLTEAADLRDVGLHNVERPGFEPWLKALPPRQDLTAGNRNSRRSAQRDKIFECIRN